MSTENNRKPANWIKRVFLGATTEIGYSDKGSIGFWQEGRWLGCHNVDSMTELLANQHTVKTIVDEASTIASKRREEKEGSTAVRKQKMAAKLYQELQKAKRNGIDVATLMNTPDKAANE